MKSSGRDYNAYDIQCYFIYSCLYTQIESKIKINILMISIEDT